MRASRKQIMRRTYDLCVRRQLVQLLLVLMVPGATPALLPSSLARRTVEVSLNEKTTIGVVEVADWAWWEEKSKDDNSNPHGAKLWPAAVAVARYINSLPLQGKTVLELGCGNGLCSLAAAQAGATSVIATDLSADALGLTDEACAINDVKSVTTQILDLGGKESLPAADVVVCADLLYDDDLAALVAKRAVEASQRGSWVIIGTDLKRGPRLTFLKKLKELHPGSEESFTFDDCHSVALKAVGWKEKTVGMLQLNAPDSAT